MDRVCCLLTNFTMIDDLEIVTLSYVVYFGLLKRFRATSSKPQKLDAFGIYTPGVFTVW